MSVTDIAAFGASNSSTTTAGASNRPDRQLQSVFSAVLEAAGRQGYASAEAVAPDAPLDSRLRDAWSDWSLSERVSGRYASRGADYAAFKQPYGDLLVRA